MGEKGGFSKQNTCTTQSSVTMRHCCISDMMSPSTGCATVVPVHVKNFLNNILKIISLK